MPWATITQTLPRRLHSMQTLWEAIGGPPLVEVGADHLEQLAPVDRAAVELEVDVHVVGDRRRGRERRDVLRARRRRAAMKSSTSAKLRSAWMPPAVAQAPIVTRRRDSVAHAPDALGVLGGGDRALHEREVVGPVVHPAARLEEVGDLHRAGEREQLVLEVEQAELAAVAGGELPDRELRPPRSQLRAPRASAPTRAYGNTGPVPADELAARACSARSGRSRTSCCARARRRSARRGTPRSRRAATVKRIITSGPTTIATVLRGIEARARGISDVTTPTRPRQPRRRGVDRHAARRRRARRQRSSSSR